MTCPVGHDQPMTRTDLHFCGQHFIRSLTAKHDVVNYFLTLVMTRAGHEKLTPGHGNLNPGHENFSSGHVKTIPDHKTASQTSEKKYWLQNCRPVLVMDWSYHLKDP